MQLMSFVNKVLVFNLIKQVASCQVGKELFHSTPKDKRDEPLVSNVLYSHHNIVTKTLSAHTQFFFR